MVLSEVAIYLQGFYHWSSCRRSDHVCQLSSDMADILRPVNVCVATSHAVEVAEPAETPNYGFADCAAILDITSAAFPTGLRQDPTIDLPVKDFKPKSDDDKRLQDLCMSLSRKSS